MKISHIGALLVVAGVLLGSVHAPAGHAPDRPVAMFGPACASVTTEKAEAWSRAELDRAGLARGTSYLTADERNVVRYVNLARLYPRKFAVIHLYPLRSRFNGTLLELPGRTPIRTKEGVDALNECIEALEEQEPCKALLPARGLSRAAADHVKDSGPAGTIGHTGADGSTLGERIERYGRWMIRAGENIAYGEQSPLYIVMQLLVDDGTPSRGHRHNIFNCSFGVVGVAIGPHAAWQTMCVMDFAGGFEERKGH